MIQDAEHTHLIVAKLADLFLNASINDAEGLDLLIEPQPDGTSKLIFGNMDFHATILLNNSHLPEKN